MTADRRLDVAMPRILADLGAGPKADYIDDVLAGVAATSQRPAWTFPNRWIRFEVSASPNRYWASRARWVAVLIVLALVAALAVVAVGSRRKLPPPFGPAANGLLTFGQNGDIYVGNPKDGTSRDIVSDPNTFDYLPFFAPDGARLAFFRSLDRRTNGETELVIVQPDGSHLLIPATPTMHELPWAAVWAPDSRTIALVTTARLDGQLVMVDAMGVEAPRVVDFGSIVPDGIAFQPPDGRRILFRGNLGGQIGLYTANPDGSDLRTLIPPYSSVAPADSAWPSSHTLVADLRNPVYSPDGTTIAFVKYTSDLRVTTPDVQDVGVAQGYTSDQRPRIFVMPSDGSAPPKVVGYTPGDVVDAWPVFSPDGTKLAFLRDRGAASIVATDTGSWQCAVVDLSTGAVLAAGPRIDSGQAALSWSPDGTRLLVVHHGTPQRVWVVDPNGGPGLQQPWSPEEPGLWLNYQLRNGLDPGTYQRLAGP